MNAIYLRRRCKVHVPAGEGNLSPALVATLQKNLESLGFVFSERLFAHLQTLTQERLAAFSKDLIRQLREWVGAHRVFRPLYPNFPAEVMTLSAVELYLNAMRHYWTHQLPNTAPTARDALVETPSLRKIDLGTKADFESIFTQLAAARSSLSAQDKLDVAWFVSQYRDDIVRLLPATIPQKENLAVVGAQLLRHTTVAAAVLDGQLKTATDVLRLAVAMHDGDVSLAQPAKFGRFSRRERRTMLGWLERATQRAEDMFRWPEPWKRLGERLHPGDYAEQFPQTYAAFCALRNDEPIVTFNRQLEALLEQADVAAALELLIARPGDLARRLDHLLRLSPDSTAVLAALQQIAGRVSTPVLLQVRTHFESRLTPVPLRVFFPKGDVAKVFALRLALPALPSGVPAQVMEACDATLRKRFAQLPPLGKCFLDPALAQYLVPFSQRSASKALRTVVRGSRLPLPDGPVLRFFLWWKNGRSRTDIDLSATVFDAQFRYVDIVSYYNLKTFGGYHSGDIVDAPHGAAEFIDLDLVQTRARGVRYVVMSLNSYTEQPYCDLPECFAGWMSRRQANSGEIFEPRTVHQKVDVASNTGICIPAIFDLVDRQVIWADMALKQHLGYNNVQNNLSGVGLLLRSLVEMRKTSLHTLFSLHIQARGEQVLDPASADTLFSVEHGLTPFDLDQIRAEYL